MPTYLVRCGMCNGTKEIVEGMNDTGRKTTKCKKCGIVMQHVPNEKLEGFIDPEGKLAKYKGLD